MRPSNRAFDELRKITLEPNVNPYAEGSCRVCFGNTEVICTLSVEDKMPMWLRNSGKGWLTAEYGMLPRSTLVRMDREAAKGHQTGRTLEIQRLIGRALRASLDLTKIQDICLRMDCDVIIADGGTRTAAITGGFIALHKGLERLEKLGIIKESPLLTSVCAISCGFYENEAVLDLDYEEDSHAQTDANFVLTGDGRLVEIQGTAEGEPFARKDLDKLLDLAIKGAKEITELQNKVLGI